MRALPADALVGRSIQVFAETDSTNNLARDAGTSGAPEGLVFFAESQRAGRGRRGRAWISPAGSALLFSVLLRPAAPRAFWSRLTLVAVRSLLDAVEREAGIAAAWKWPNDVMIGARKLAGILIEATPQFVVLGIGLNVKQRSADFPEELREQAVSLEMVADCGVNREKLAAAIMANLDRAYRGNWAGEYFSTLRDFCVARSSLKLGDFVRVRHGDTWVEGAVAGFTAEAHLRIASAEGEIEISGGMLEMADPNAEC
jgi:BirA family biotin operon repressor/biotin-[acetyl-CoA-carboxylase] ligase